MGVAVGAAGIALVVFFVVYQQLENHLLQPWIFSPGVNFNPFAMLVAILLAVELAGILGALLAIPIAGIIQVPAGPLGQPPRPSQTAPDHRRGPGTTDAGPGAEPAPAPHTDPVQHQGVSKVVPIGGEPSSPATPDRRNRSKTWSSRIRRFR